MSESEFVTIVEATGTESKQLNPIAAVLKGKKGSALDHLVKACNCKLNKRHGYITDMAGNVIKISQLYEYLGINTTGAVRCPKCLEPVSYDLLFYHFEDHKMSIETVYKLFLNNFTSWEYNNSTYRYLGEPISFETIS